MLIILNDTNNEKTKDEYYEYDDNEMKSLHNFY